MKNILKYIILLGVSILGTSLYAGERPIEVSQLPEKAVKFVKTNFPQAQITLATKDGWWLSAEYDVSLNDSTSIEFDSAGDWKEIKNSVNGLSLNLLPEKIKNTLEIKFVGAKVKSIERKPRIAYEIELFDGRDLKFDKNLVLYEVED